MGKCAQVLKDGWEGRWKPSAYGQALIAGLALGSLAWPGSLRRIAASPAKLEQCRGSSLPSDFALDVRRTLSMEETKP